MNVGRFIYIFSFRYGIWPLQTLVLHVTIIYSLLKPKQYFHFQKKKSFSILVVWSICNRPIFLKYGFYITQVSWLTRVLRSLESEISSNCSPKLSIMNTLGISLSNRVCSQENKYSRACVCKSIRFNIISFHKSFYR